MSDPLVVWLVSAMKVWAPEASMPNKDIGHYESIAQDVAAVVRDPAEKPLFVDDPSRAKMALQLLGIPAKESSYWRSVDDGTCNGLHPENVADLALLAKAGMPCDHQAAWSIWQIHVGKGIWLTGDGITSMGGTGPAITGPDLIRDRRLAARVALHIVRASFKANVGLCFYSGERYKENEPDHGCPLAAKRVAIARDYFKEHPYLP